MTTSSRLLRDARTRTGLTQNELAARAGVTQSVISAYESGRRQPALETLERLVSATGARLEVRVVAPRPGSALADVRRHRGRLRERLGALGAVDIRVFGSVARGEERPGSDVDLLVDLSDDVGAFALLRMRSEAEEILGRPVDIVPAEGLKADVAARVFAEAVPV